MKAWCEVHVAYCAYMEVAIARHVDECGLHNSEVPIRRSRTLAKAFAVNGDLQSLLAAKAAPNPTAQKALEVGKDEGGRGE